MQVHIGFKAYALIIAPLVTACSSVTDPWWPAGAVLMEPPRVYALWWSLTEDCSGLRGDFEATNWYVVPGSNHIVADGRTYHGYWWSHGNRIVLAEQSILDGTLVRHEMLHAITARRGHSSDLFVDRCGGVVACSGDCAIEAGESPQPPSGAARITPAELETDIRIDPIESSEATYAGWVAVTVSTTNRRADPVWVDLEPVAPGEPASATFGYIIEPGGSGHTYVWEHQLGFAAGQTRRLVFDLELSAGEYGVRGFFNSDTTGAVTIKVWR